MFFENVASSKHLDTAKVEVRLAWKSTGAS